jgi:hypothetical protein
MDRITPLLAQYPGPLKLQMSRSQRLLMPAVAVALAGGCVASALDPTNGAWRWLALLGVIFFLACGGAAVAMLRRDRLHLVLDAQGFVFTSGANRRSYKWTDVSDFAVVGDALVPLKTRVGFNYAGGRSSRRQGQELPDWRDARLSDTYGLSVAECVELLSQWQQRALSKA